MSLPQVTVVGRLVRPPEGKFTTGGKAVCSFTVAASERKLNKQTEQWEDGEKSFLRCTVWEQQAENLMESDLQQGAEVVVVGRYFQREYESNGETRQSTELKVESVAVAITRGQQATARKIQRQQGQGGGGQQQGGWGGGQQAQQGGWDQGAPQGGGWPQQGGQGQQGGGWGGPQQGQQGGGGWGPPQGGQQGPWNQSGTAAAGNAGNGYPDEPPFHNGFVGSRPGRFRPGRRAPEEVMPC